MLTMILAQTAGDVPAMPDMGMLEWAVKHWPGAIVVIVLSLALYFFVAYTWTKWSRQRIENLSAEQALELQAEAVRHKQNIERLDAEQKIAALEAEKEASKALVAERVKETVSELNSSRAAADAAVIESNKLVENVHNLLTRMEQVKT